MKFIITLLLTVATYANANIFVNWAAGSGFYELGGGGGSIFTPGSGDSFLAQLIWRPDNTGSVFGGDGAVEDSLNNYVTGDDVWLANFIVTEGSTALSEWGNFVGPEYNDNGAVVPFGAANPGYIYARVFENAAPIAGDYYYTGPVVAVVNWDPTAVPAPGSQPYAVNIEFGDRFDGTYGSQVQPVPEPGTMALFALGLATLGVSRRRRKVQA